MIALGCDHGGYALMQKVKEHLTAQGIEFYDFGTYSQESCDYPVYAEAAAKAVAANKIPGIRAALCSDCFSAEMTRRHNDANMLAMGARVLGEGLALKIVDTFLSSEFEGGRHQRRVDMITALENR